MSASKIEHITQQYWNISLAFEGRAEGNAKITTGGAIRTLGESITQLNPERAIAQRISSLHRDIIIGGRTQCQAVPGNSKLIQFMKP